MGGGLHLQRLYNIRPQAKTQGVVGLDLVAGVADKLGKVLVVEVTADNFPELFRQIIVGLFGLRKAGEGLTEPVSGLVDFNIVPKQFRKQVLHFHHSSCIMFPNYKFENYYIRTYSACQGVEAKSGRFFFTY